MTASEPMKLHWSPRSPYVRKVMIVAHETGTVSRLQCVRSVVAMDRPNPDVMRDNPLGKIPTLVTPHGSLFGSLVICEYLDGLHEGTPLFPRERQARFEALRWHALGDGMLDVAVLWRNEGMQPAAQRNQQWLASFELKMRSALDTVERESPQLARAPLSIGHVAIGCALGYLDYRFEDVAFRQGRPGLSAWLEQFEQRPSAKQTHPADG